MSQPCLTFSMFSPASWRRPKHRSTSWKVPQTTLSRFISYHLSSMCLLTPVYRSMSFFLSLPLAGMLFPSPQLQEHVIFLFRSTLKWFSIRSPLRKDKSHTYAYIDGEHPLVSMLFHISNLASMLFHVVCMSVLSRDCRLLEETMFTVRQLGIFYEYSLICRRKEKRGSCDFFHFYEMYSIFFTVFKIKISQL